MVKTRKNNYIAGSRSTIKYNFRNHYDCENGFAKTMAKLDRMEQELQEQKKKVKRLEKVDEEFQEQKKKNQNLEKVDEEFQEFKKKVKNLEDTNEINEFLCRFFDISNLLLKKKINKKTELYKLLIAMNKERTLFSHYISNNINDNDVNDTIQKINGFQEMLQNEKKIDFVSKKFGKYSNEANVKRLLSKLDNEITEVKNNNTLEKIIEKFFAENKQNK